ncbi:MAG TPA: methylamine utilization protein [Hyphomonadaceae bacterium]|jgi:plastocyanin|nr:methylamine utilization protein [Hyphomonadaceae bacterium]
MILRSVLAACAFGAIVAPACAGDLSVTVTTPDGKPLADAVITLPGNGAKPAFAWKLEVAQKDKQFIPFVLIVPQGAEVSFPNLDKFRHHVYSFSKGNKFELELYGREDKRAVTFKSVGTAAIGCNIHDTMVGFIRIVDTPFAAKTGADGVAKIPGAPDGATKLTVWHPYAKAKEQIAVSDVSISPSGSAVTVALDVTAQSPAMSHH